MTEQEYRAHPALNASRLVLMDESPQHYFRNEHKESDAMRFGTIVHTAILEPEKFAKLYVVEPEVILGEPRNNRLKAHKQYLEQWRKEQSFDAIILDPEEMSNLTGMLLSIKTEIARPLSGSISLGEILASQEREVAGFQELFGRECKARADLLCNTSLGRTVVDFKKVGRKGQASPSKFSSIVSNLHYEAKAWWYMQVFKADAFIWVAIEENSPHPIGIYNAEPFLEIGEKKIRKWMAKLQECEAKNEWPWYTNGAEALYPSSWQIKQADENFW